jgi:chromosomal replication initiator protein
LLADVQPPNLETRIAILQKKAASEQLSIPVEVLSFIAANITANIRELEGSLIRLLAHASLTGQEITLELAKRVLTDMIVHRVREVSVEAIQTRVASAFGIPEDMMRARKKTAEIALPRQVAMYLSRSLTNKSLKAIGGYFGGRDHSTVIHAVKTIEDLLAREPVLKHKVDGIINSLYD